MKPRILLAAAALLALSHAAAAAAGADVLQGQCAACHALAKTDAGAQALLDRKGPTLAYAGVKFNRDWLVAWLQAPTVIRPGGAMYSRAVRPGEDGGADTIDPAKLAPHPKLGAAEAAAVADALMALGTKDGAVTRGAFKGEPAGSMAALLFNKLRGCSSCHAIKGTGGLSGPELGAAGDRLQPDFVVEYLRDPQKFDPHVWMPRLELTDADVQKLAAYLMTRKQGAAQ